MKKQGLLTMGYLLLMCTAVIIAAVVPYKYSYYLCVFAFVIATHHSVVHLFKFQTAANNKG